MTFLFGQSSSQSGDLTTALLVLGHGLGIHLWDIPRSTFRELAYYRVILLSETGTELASTNLHFVVGSDIILVYVAAMGIIKISILLLYLRLFLSQEKLRYCIYAALFIIAGFLISTEVSLIFLCLPPVEVVPRVQARACISLGKHALTQVIFNFLSDIIIIALPVPAVWALHLPRRQRLAVIGIFAVGIM